MKQTVNFIRFCDAFENSQYRDNFSYDGKHILYNYLLELEEELDTEFELDICALCCEWTEYDSIMEYNNDYGTNFDDHDTFVSCVDAIPIPHTDGYIVHLH